MGSTFDIFNVSPDGPLWVGTVHGLKEAVERIARLALTFPGGYFINLQEEGVVAEQAQEWADLT